MVMKFLYLVFFVCDILFTLIACSVPVGWFVSKVIHSAWESSVPTQARETDTVQFETSCETVAVIVFLTIVSFLNLSYIRNITSQPRIKMFMATLWEIWVVAMNIFFLFILTASIENGMRIQMPYGEVDTHHHISNPRPSFYCSVMTFSITFLSLYIMHMKHFLNGIMYLPPVLVMAFICAEEFRKLHSKNVLCSTDMWTGAIVGIVYATIAVRNLLGAIVLYRPKRKASKRITKRSLKLRS